MKTGASGLKSIQHVEFYPIIEGKVRYNIKHYFKGSSETSLLTTGVTKNILDSGVRKPNASQNQFNVSLLRKSTFMYSEKALEQMIVEINMKNQGTSTSPSL